jgi:hypothetical protein
MPECCAISSTLPSADASLVSPSWDTSPRFSSGGRGGGDLVRLCRAPRSVSRYTQSSYTWDVGLFCVAPKTTTFGLGRQNESLSTRVQHSTVASTASGVTPRLLSTSRARVSTPPDRRVHPSPPSRRLSIVRLPRREVDDVSSSGGFLQLFHRYEYTPATSEVSSTSRCKACCRRRPRAWTPPRFSPSCCTASARGSTASAPRRPGL